MRRVSSSLTDDGTSRTSYNVVSSRSPGGGTGDEVCRFRLHRIEIRKVETIIIKPAVVMRLYAAMKFDCKASCSCYPQGFAVVLLILFRASLCVVNLCNININGQL